MALEPRDNTHLPAGPRGDGGGPRAVANVLEKPQGGEQGQGSATLQGRDAVSAAGSLGAEIVAAPLEVAAAAIGAAGQVVTSALSGSSGEDRDNADRRRAADGLPRGRNHRRSATSRPDDQSDGEQVFQA